METMDILILIEILEASVKKNGEIQLTNKHLLNILKMVTRINDSDDSGINFDPNWD